MAKNQFVSIEALDANKVREVVKGSDMVKTAETKGKGGRPRKLADQKASDCLNVYFTSEEKQRVQDYCDKLHLSFSALAKHLLAKEGVL